MVLLARRQVLRRAFQAASAAHACTAGARLLEHDNSSARKPRPVFGDYTGYVLRTSVFRSLRTRQMREDLLKSPAPLPVIDTPSIYYSMLCAKRASHNALPTSNNLTLISIFAALL